MASEWAAAKASEFCKGLRSSGVGDLIGKQERTIAASYDAAAEEVYLATVDSITHADNIDSFESVLNSLRRNNGQ